MPNSSWTQVNDWSDVPRAIAVCEQIGAIGQAHLMRALYAGRISYWPLLPTSSANRFKTFTRETAGRPTVISIGDDDGMNRGPAGWSLTKRAIQWARGVLLHGAGAEVEHYEAAVLAAQRVHRVLVVECCTATLDAWARLLKAAPHRPNTLVIYAQDGVHPLPIPAEQVQ